MLVFRRRQPQQQPHHGRTIPLPAIILALALLALGSFPLRAAEALPRDLAKFIERREGCDHFRGEEAYDEERRKFLLMRMKQLCTGTDRQLERLKSKYRTQARVMKKLDSYEPSIELPRN